MTNSWMNRLGDWNPQLLREYRGRIKMRSVIAAVALSAIAQVFFLLIFSQESYLTSQEKWSNLCVSLTWILPYALFTVGSYYLVSDLTQEEKRGTLNFIRLSPYPASKILLGKLLGVPALPYLTIALFIPLHFVSALGAGISLLFMLSFYVLLIAGCIFCYSAAMLYGLVGSTSFGLANRQTTTAIAFTAIAFLLVSPLFMFWNINVVWRSFSNLPISLSSNTDFPSWFYIPLSSNAGFAHGFTLLNLGISTAIIWRILLRRFRQPRSTVLSKRQSYAISAYLEVFVLGFFLESTGLNVGGGAAEGFFMYVFTAILLLILMFGICPQRQALLDWLRYQSQGRQSLMWADKSPILLAILIHILIATALLLPWFLMTNFGRQYLVETVIAYVSIVNTLLICGVLIQQILAAKIRNPLVWAIGVLGLWLVVPPTLLGLLRLVPTNIPATTIIWTFFGYPYWHFTEQNNLSFTVLGIVAQSLLLAFLLWRFAQTLRRLKIGTQSWR